MTSPSTESGASAFIRYIDTQEAFDELMREIGGEPLLAVDTEAASFHRYLDRIYLIQLSTRGLTAVVDPLAVKRLDSLGAVLADRATEIIFHDADYDLRILDRDYGFHATNLFDTRIAAQLVNEPGIGLAALLEKYLGLKLDKRFQRADWSVRPLLPGMLEYAASDTRHLPELRDILKKKLEEAGRWHWAEEEFLVLENVRWNPSGPADQAYLRLKGAKALRGRPLALLRELHEWREDAARKLDRAQFRVMHNEVLMAIASAMPTDLEALLAIKGISPDVARRRGPELLAAVRRGLDASEDTIPVFERTRRPPADPRFDAALERLKLVRNAVASRLDLPPGLVCPNGTLEAIARAAPRNLDDLGKLSELRRWQIEVAGSELLQAFKGGNEKGASIAP
ncbi:MAG: ribonuclease D [Gemmatimonadota bacterium]